MDSRNHVYQTVDVGELTEVATPLLNNVSNSTVGPPAYTASASEDEELTLTTLGDHGSPKIDDMEQPPAYDIAVKLPTYEEAQLGKIASEEQHGRIGVLNNGLHPEQRNFNFIASFTHPNSDPHFDSNVADLALGTDVYFFASFLVAFLFNWIGFLLLICVCHTVAGRYGALAGFGLSLAKWTLIVKHSTDLASNDNNWLWWLIMAFGVLICVRAVIQYLCIKREWHRLSRTAQERVVFFY